LRVCSPGVTISSLKETYEDSFLTELFPDTSLSKNSVSSFVRDLGRTCDRIREFMRSRAQKTGIDEHLLVDGTLKTNNSRINSLSEFSRKARIKNSRDLSVLYAFNLEKKEPVCAECFPGNMLDITAYDRFVKDNGIKSGILVGDKGFPAKSIEKVLEECPDLHYLNPLKRSSKLATDHDMYSFEGVLPVKNTFLDRAESIQYRKVKLANKDKWLYSFRDAARAGKEEQDWMRHHQKDYDPVWYEKHKMKFGTIVLESDQDLSPLEAWQAYSCRWQIEIVMRYYKNALCFGTTRVHDDYSVIGNEFIDFLSTVITFRLLNIFDKEGLLETMSYKEIMRILSKAKKVKEGSEWKLVKMNPSQITVLEKTEYLILWVFFSDLT
jgi:hypothetical protein